MAVDLPHFGWPIRLVTNPDGTSGFAVVEQDTTPDLLASAAVIACTPRGHRDDDPSFGVTQLVFTQGPVDTGRLAAELQEADPRLDVTADETTQLTNAMVRNLTVNVGGSHS